MKFKIKSKIDNKDGFILYREYEHSFDCEPNVNTDIMIMIQYLTLGFDSEDMYAKEIYGYNPKGGWLIKNLKTPIYSIGNLILESDVEPGLSERLPGSESWSTYYDKDSGWVCMGDCDLADDYVAVEFIQNALVVLYNDKLVSLWLKPNFIANSIEEYNAMAESDPKETRLFWERIERLKKEKNHKQVLEKLTSIIEDKLTPQAAGRLGK